jgi:hypothetical protein
MTACVINAEAFNAWPCRHHAGRWSQTPNLPGGAPRCVRLRSPTPLNVGLYETPARQAGFVKRADFNVIARGTEACTCALTCAKAAGVRLEQKWASRIEQILTVTGTAPPPRDPNDDDDDEVEDKEDEDQPDEPAVVREPDED